MAKPFYGLGGNLAVLACAWVAANKLDRCLVVDWRGMYYGSDQDYFHCLFESLDNQVALSEVDRQARSVFPDYWDKFVFDIPQQQKGYQLTAATPDLLFDPASGFSPEEHSLAVVARDGKFFYMADYRAEIIRFFNQLRPANIIEAEVEAFAAQYLGENAIGIHFRHGNGEPTVVPPSFDWFCAAIDKLTESSCSPNPPIFVATDCELALQAFRQRFRDRVLSFPKAYLPAGQGGLHYRVVENDKLRAAVEALIDIRLLSKCASFAGSTSFFSRAANFWGRGFDKTNSLWFSPRIRAFKPTKAQVAISKCPEVLTLFGPSYPLDNLYFDAESNEIYFQDIVVGILGEVFDDPEALARVKEKILGHRLY